MAEEIENNEEIQSQEENQLEGVDNELEQGEETQGEETEQNEDGGSSSDGDAPKEDCPPCKGGAPLGWQLLPIWQLAYGFFCFVIVVC